MRFVGVFDVPQIYINAVVGCMDEWKKVWAGFGGVSPVDLPPCFEEITGQEKNTWLTRLTMKPVKPIFGFRVIGVGTFILLSTNTKWVVLSQPRYFQELGTGLEKRYKTDFQKPFSFDWVGLFSGRQAFKLSFQQGLFIFYAFGHTCFYIFPIFEA